MTRPAYAIIYHPDCSTGEHSIHQSKREAQAWARQRLARFLQPGERLSHWERFPVPGGGDQFHMVIFHEKGEHDTRAVVGVP